MSEENAMFWIGLVTGLFIGASLGVLIMGALIAARDADERAQKNPAPRYGPERGINPYKQ